ncbi:MAG: hypothetical protein HRU18_06595 [Pseudoalteromonas sp.]|uniref:G8 domain-containing protein n=1 Tax=Pseudoalteromonas sp. TaxID=53249 RepID=UPI001D1E49F4|nr:G8 domain-containing protein [Pseudoalteromonas sp.]NRA77858.1 hypothetical protein [Pseudoalteromonas sp.]
MTEIRFAGPAAGENVNVTDFSLGADSGSVNVSSYKQPEDITGVPIITGSQRVGTVNAIDLNGLTSPSYQWRIVGGSDLGTASTQNNMAAMGQWIECEVTHSGGVTVTPPMRVYMNMADASHNDADDAFVAIMPQSDATHIAAQDGNWSSPSTWIGGVPTAGARVLIPYGITVTYDWSRFRRLDIVRIDGKLEFTRSKSTWLTAETVMITQGGDLEIGTAANPIPPQYTALITPSDRDYRTDSTQPTPINILRDTKILSRGVIWQGRYSAWGADKDNAVKTAIGGAPMAGDTSLVLAKIPVGWQVGDTIVIPATRVRDNLLSESEERVITAISGGMVSWSEPLVYDHDKQNDNSLRTDLQPAIGNLSRNIKIVAENKKVPAHMLPHCMGMHMMSTTDLWRVEVDGCGRTQKSDDIPTGHINDNGDFRFYDSENSVWVEETLTAASNRNGRYGLHLHFVGFNKAFTDTINNCSVRDARGWGIVHHGCEASMNLNCVYKYPGAGMVGETGNETGSWSGNWVVNGTNKAIGSPKDAEAQKGRRGDFARLGYGMYFNGRELNVHDNYCGDNSISYVWHHRWDAASSFTPPIDHNTDELTIQDIMGGGSFTEKLTPIHNPIHGFSGNESAGVAVFGLFITKGGPAQGHGWNTQLIDFKTWGYKTAGMAPEYIGQYTIVRPDCLPSGWVNGEGDGVLYGGNTFQVAVVNGRFEDCDYGIRFTTEESTDSIPVLDVYDADEPRCIAIGNEYVNCANKILHPDTAFSYLHEDDNEVSPVDPSHDLPFIVFRDQTGGAELDNLATGTLSDTVGNAGKLPKPADEAGLPRALTSANYGTRQALSNYAATTGYYTYGGKRILPFPLYFGDRATGKPIKTWHAVEFGFVPVGANLGEYTVSANPPTVTGIPTINTVKNTPVTLDLTPFLSDTDGQTPTVSPSHVRPSHGKLKIAGNVLTFTPDVGFQGTDECSVWIDDGAGQSTRIDIPIDIDVTAAQPISAGDWTLGQATGDAVLVTLNAPPDTGGRDIRKVEYTTDGGNTWKRLCYKWVAGGHIVTDSSAAVALTSGQNLSNVQLRYITERDDTLGSDTKSIILD